MEHFTHDYLVDTITGDQVCIPVDKGDDTDLEVAQALAKRLTPTGVMWGALLRDDDDNDPGPWVVIPAANITAVTIRRRPVPAPTIDPPVATPTPAPAPSIDTYPGAVSPAPAPVTGGSVATG